MGIQLKRVDMRLIVTGLAALALVACSSETKQETAITTPEAAAPAEAVKASCEAPAAAHHGKKKMKKHKAHKAAAKAEEVKKDEPKAEEAKAEEAKKEEKAEEKK
ncbi:MAG: hypothetical protein CNLJKLNK_00998 [Holosporales bacterium]